MVKLSSNSLSSSQKIITPIFQYSLTVRMHDIDAAGVLFFAQNLYYTHDAYESFLNHHQQSINQLIQNNYLLPIKHTSADFKAPVFLNEQLTIQLFVDSIKETEFTLSYQFLNAKNVITATTLTQHVCLDQHNRKRTPLPQSILNLLSGNKRLLD
jgi:1,4-dihydroxy-2-naphthoyl-CoA hydrolase